MIQERIDELMALFSDESVRTVVPKDVLKETAWASAVDMELLH